MEMKSTAHNNTYSKGEVSYVGDKLLREFVIDKNGNESEINYSYNPQGLMVERKVFFEGKLKKLSRYRYSGSK